MGTKGVFCQQWIADPLKNWECSTFWAVQYQSSVVFDRKHSIILNVSEVNPHVIVFFIVMYVLTCVISFIGNYRVNDTEHVHLIAHQGGRNSLISQRPVPRCKSVWWCFSENWSVMLLGNCFFFSFLVFLFLQGGGVFPKAYWVWGVCYCCLLYIGLVKLPMKKIWLFTYKMTQIWKLYIHKYMDYEILGIILILWF